MGVIWEAATGQTLGQFGDERLEKRGRYLAERLVAYSGKGVSVRQLGGNRAGEMRIARFLHNPKVTVGEMMSAALARTSAQAGGRHVLAIQDTSALRVDKKGLGLSFHPVLAVDADAGTVLGLIDNIFLTRKGSENRRANRAERRAGSA